MTCCVRLHGPQVYKFIETIRNSQVPSFWNTFPYFNFCLFSLFLKNFRSFLNIAILNSTAKCVNSCNLQFSWELLSYSSVFSLVLHVTMISTGNQIFEIFFWKQMQLQRYPAKWIYLMFCFYTIMFKSVIFKMFHVYIPTEKTSCEWRYSTRTLGWIKLFTKKTTQYISVQRLLYKQPKKFNELASKTI